ncbi:DUF456 domain-containing protein [Streptomyces boncukensis]|uniref:DUF456 domain-containing protein n=1 Tax=Streptomyces boncukensis TaxID=2711219 RepID=A0A6G4WX62_9ACTN|nr:DUF456 domain-containing protein [Streptomyces boncukensis]NGO69825.1 DUF456 domain-containing protein [Streptomyces boncukensis]
MGTAGTLSAWEPLLVGLVLLLGTVGTVLPGVSGPLVVWAAVFWWATARQTSSAWWLLTGATALLLLNTAVQLLLPRRIRPRHATDVRRRALLAAGGAGIVGFFLLPVLGVVPGFLAGLYGWERVRLGSHGAAAASARAVLRAVGWRKLIELTACLLVAGAWIATLVWAPS